MVRFRFSAIGIPSSNFLPSATRPQIAAREQTPDAVDEAVTAFVTEIPCTVLLVALGCP